MPYFVLCWLLATALASPLDFHGSQTSQTVLDTDHGNVNLTASGEAFIGWHDPRMNGGRFLDVSDDQKDKRGTQSKEMIPVHEQEVRRTAEHHHFCLIRSIHHDRRRVPSLHQVRCIQCLPFLPYVFSDRSDILRNVWGCTSATSTMRTLVTETDGSRNNFLRGSTISQYGERVGRV